MDCRLIENDSGQCECTVCGRTFRKLAADCESIHRNCGAVPADEQPPKLGDKVEHLLTKLGITQDRYREVKELFGLPPTCGCEERKAWLNRVSDWWRGE